MGVLHATGEALTLALSGDAALLAIIGVSLRTTLVSLVMAFPLAVAAGYWLATTRSPARAICIWLVQTALSLPTVLIGLLPKNCACEVEAKAATNARERMIFFMVFWIINLFWLWRRGYSPRRRCD